MIYARLRDRVRSGWPARRSPPIDRLALAVRGRPVGVASGIFLAVDWALMTDIIPKARRAATWASGTSPPAASGALRGGRRRSSSIDAGNTPSGRAPGRGLAFVRRLLRTTSSAALLLTRVDERRREDVPAPRADAGPRARAVGWPADVGSASSPRKSRTRRSLAAPRPPVARAPRARPRAGASAIGSGSRPQPGHEGPQEDEVVEPDRPRPEAEQRLELDDRQRQRREAEQRRRGSQTRPQPPGPRREDQPERRRHPLHPRRERPEQPGRRRPANWAAQSMKRQDQVDVAGVEVGRDRERQQEDTIGGRERPLAVRPVDRPEQEEDRRRRARRTRRRPTGGAPRARRAAASTGRRRRAGTARSGRTGCRRSARSGRRPSRPARRRRPSSPRAISPAPMTPATAIRIAMAASRRGSWSRDTSRRRARWKTPARRRVGREIRSAGNPATARPMPADRIPSWARGSGSLAHRGPIVACRPKRSDRPIPDAGVFSRRRGTSSSAAPVCVRRRGSVDAPVDGAWTGWWPDAPPRRDFVDRRPSRDVPRRCIIPRSDGRHGALGAPRCGGQIRSPPPHRPGRDRPSGALGARVR